MTPLLRKIKNDLKPELEASAAAVPVDIPDSWDPRTKQQPTGLIACRLRAAVLFDPSSPQDKKMTPSLSLGPFFYAGEGGRTLTPLELVPKTSASAIPPLPHGNFIYSSKIRRKSQLPKDNSLFASA